MITKLMTLEQSVKIGHRDRIKTMFSDSDRYFHNVEDLELQPFKVGDIVKLVSVLGTLGVIESVDEQSCIVSIVEKDKVYGYSKIASDMEYSFDSISIHPNKQLARRIKKDLALERADVAILKWLDNK